MSGRVYKYGSVAIVFLCATASNLLEAQPACDVRELVVGEGHGHPGEQVEVDLLGGVSCEVTGFSIAIGHDSDTIQFVDATPGKFLVEHAGADLFFQANAQNDGGFASVAVVFDISFPITVVPTTIDRGTVLATLFYEVSTEAEPGTSPLLNRTLTYGANPFSNVYSGRPGKPPIEPQLVDGAVTIDPKFQGPAFVRGDTNADTEVDISDAIFILNYLFIGGEALGCIKGADSNDSDDVDLSDSVYLLIHLFLSGPQPPPPFPDCGFETTDDALPCEASPCGGE